MSNVAEGEDEQEWIDESLSEATSLQGTSLPVDSLSGRGIGTVNIFGVPILVRIEE